MNSKNDRTEILGLVNAWSKALEAKDVDALLANYAPDAVLFDAIPPYKQEGIEAIRQVWENCLPCFPEAFKSEHRDLEVQVEGDAAFVFGVHHIVAENHPAGQTWFRITVGFRRIEGKWKVQHEHVSIPFNPMNDQAWYIKDPNTLDQPDYSNAC